MLITLWGFPLNKNSVPPLARPLSPAGATPSAAYLHLVGLRRGLANVWPLPPQASRFGPARHDHETLGG
jgi:hypothetical protein